MINGNAKFEMEIVLSNVLQKAGFLDRITVISYLFDDISDHITGIFKYNNDDYAYDVGFLENGDVEGIFWNKLEEIYDRC